MGIPSSREKSERVAAVIVAAGRGQRMGGVDKVLAELAGQPILAHSLAVFETCTAIDEIVLVLSERNLEQGRRLVEDRGWSKVQSICTGGEERQDSVREGLLRLNGPAWVVIHDGARPLVTEYLILCGLKEARERGAAVAAVPVKDTLKVVGSDLEVESTPDRSTLWAVQTPQIFRYDLIREAYAHAKEPAPDDAVLIERMGHRVRVFMGSYDNIKITTPEDLVVAEALMKRRNSATK